VPRDLAIVIKQIGEAKPADGSAAPVAEAKAEEPAAEAAPAEEAAVEAAPAAEAEAPAAEEGDILEVPPAEEAAE